VQYVFLWASGTPNSRAAPGSPHSSYDTVCFTAHLSTEWKYTVSQVDTPICTRRTTTHQFIWQQQHTCATLGGSRMRRGCTTPRDSVFSSGTLAPILGEWSFQEQYGFDLTASTPLSDVPTPAGTNGVCPPLLHVSVVHKNKPSTMFSSNVQSIDLHMDCTAWRFSMMRQLNSNSTSAPRTSAASELIVATGSNSEEEATARDRQGESIAICFTRKVVSRLVLKKRESGFPRKWTVINLLSLFSWLPTSDN